MNNTTAVPLPRKIHVARPCANTINCRYYWLFPAEVLYNDTYMWKQQDDSFLRINIRRYTPIAVVTTKHCCSRNYGFFHPTTGEIMNQLSVDLQRKLFEQDAFVVCSVVGFEERYHICRTSVYDFDSPRHLRGVAFPCMEIA